MAISYDDVSACFEECYDRLRSVNGENAPSSYTWIAPTWEDLAEEVGSGDLPAKPRSSHAVAWAYECNGGTAQAIESDWSVDDIRDLFWSSFGFDEPFPGGEDS